MLTLGQINKIYDAMYYCIEVKFACLKSLPIHGLQSN